MFSDKQSTVNLAVRLFAEIQRLNARTDLVKRQLAEIIVKMDDEQLKEDAERAVVQT